MSTVVKDLGAVSAYAYAVEKGYTGTEAEFAELMADYAEVGQRAEDAADSALESKTAAQTAATTATNKASEATTAAQTATTKAGEASMSASQASASATTASTKASEASQSASTASAKATEATTAAGTATTAKNDAVAAKTAAQAAQTAAETAQGAAEDAAESVSASAAQIATNTADITDLKEELNALQSLEWSNGYISPTGNINDGDGSRKYSNLLVCPPNTEVKYVAESNHTGILGISFYDVSGAFIGGVANNGTMGEEMTVTSPSLCAFCRLSTKTAIVDSSYYRISPQGIEGIVKALAPITKHGLAFIGNGGDRTLHNYNVDNVLSVAVTDDDYEVAMNYINKSGTQTSTSWRKSIDVSSFGEPVAFRMRRADDANIPIGTVLFLDVVRSTDALTVASKADTCYVNKNGNDSNDGLTKSSALLTISKAISKDFKNIIVGVGVYSETIVIDGVSGLHLSLDMSDNSFSYPDNTDNPKVIIDGDNSNAYGIKMSNCYGCDFEGVEIRNVTTYAWDIDNCSDIKISDCVLHDIAVGAQAGEGFKVTDSNVDFFNCVAYNIGTTTKGARSAVIDGFNIHGTGTVNLFDCSAWNCEDDGVSHHDASCGTIDGGEWYDCGKGGVASPTYGAKVNIKNIYSHDNAYGICAVNDKADIARNVIVSGCVCKDNTTADISASQNTLNVWNCIFDTQQTGTGGVINVIS